MNWKQLVSMWCGIGLIIFSGLVCVAAAYRAEYELFVFWAFLVTLVTSGFIVTFRNRMQNNGSKEMNLRKGFKRLVFILSLIPVLIGIIVFIAGLVDGDDDMLIGGLLTVLIGFGAIWAIYGIVLYIIKGFNANYCDNCDKEIGKIEETYTFKEHIVCAKCYERLKDTS